MSRRHSYSLAILIACGLPAAAQEPKPATQETKPRSVQVPFEILQKGRFLSGHMTVQVKINGKGPYRLIFDTGAPSNLLSLRIGKEAGILGGNRGKSPVGRSPLSPGQYLIESIELGECKLADQPAIVMDHPTVKAISEVFGPVDGIIGFPFFARFRTSIDYQKRELVFSPSSYQPPDVMQRLMQTMLGGKKRSDAPAILGAAGQWGLQVEKPALDEDPGVNIAQVLPGSPAEKAGLKVGDRLLAIGGRWTESERDCLEIAAEIPPGQAVPVTLARGGERRIVTVTPQSGF